MTDDRVSASTIGLIGGLGPGATIRYYQELVAGLQTGSARPSLVISHAETPTVRSLLAKGARADLAEYLAGHVDALARAGAELVAIAAVAPYMCAAELKRRINTLLVDPIDCINAELRARGVRRAAVLGARFVMESELYGRLEGVKAVNLSPSELEFVHDNYTRIVQAGGIEGSGADIEGIRAIALELVRRGADTIILAGTDLSLAFGEADCGFPAVDSLMSHVGAILRAASPSKGLERSLPIS
jgi:aspartate racemase